MRAPGLRGMQRRVPPFERPEASGDVGGAVVAETAEGGRAGDEVETASAWTVPNAISAVRVVLLLPLAFAAARRNETAVVVLLAAIGVSDWLDGVIARALHQISSFGQIFDPVCDRVAVAGSLVAVIATGYFPATLGVVLLAREAVISVATLVLAAAGRPRIKVTLIGKAATLMLMFSLPLYVIGGSAWDSAKTAEILAKAFAYPGAVGYYVALGQYAVAAWRSAPSRSRGEL